MRNCPARRYAALLCTLCAFLLIPSVTTAQTDITCKFIDANFLTAVRVKLGKVTNAPVYDTNVATVTRLNVGGKGIQSLAGLEYFISLKELYCEKNQLTSLPALPAALTYLSCWGNQLTSLPELPNTLEALECSANQLTSLPALPTTLTVLSCSDNLLTGIALNCSICYKVLNVRNNLLAATTDVAGFAGNWDTDGDYYFSPQRTPPDTTVQQTDIADRFIDPNFRAAVRNELGKAADEPVYDTDNFARVTRLDVSNKGIKSLEGLEYFTALTYLKCNSNQLTALPALPNTLTHLSCGGNQLTALPELPAALTDLSCGGNQLTSLPALPATLTNLTCYNNQLASLPTLPADLTELICWNNQLTALPELPAALTKLYCYSNQLTALPELPAALTELSCNENFLASIELNRNISYKHLDVRNNYLTAKKKVKGFPGKWDKSEDFLFAPQHKPPRRK